MASTFPLFICSMLNGQVGGEEAGGSGGGAVGGAAGGGSGTGAEAEVAREVQICKKINTPKINIPVPVLVS